jgi:hypothetical protein
MKKQVWISGLLLSGAAMTVLAEQPMVGTENGIP